MLVNMRRWLILAAVLALALTAALWITAQVEKSPLGRKHGNARRIPSVVAGQDHASEEQREVLRSDDENASIRCHFDGDAEAGQLTAMGEEVIQGTTNGTELSLVLPPGSWNIIWQNPSAGSVPLGQIEVDAGDVETCELAAEGWLVSGHVRNPKGQGLDDVAVNVCGNLVHTDSSGAFTGTARARSCTVRATWRDGLLSREAEPAEVSVFDARDVSLTVDDTPVAGMGLAFHMQTRGARVLRVYPDSPAEDAGVEEGDYIVSVDGTSVLGMTDRQFVTIGTGAEGSRITLELERDGEKRTVSFRRARVERPTDTGGK
jgi:hypothetical protein